jgi:predicted dehydrogenase/threonine dehydrogenase-like Zn-dependent dehydrogenase
MKQVLQNLADGETLLVEVPSPQPKEGYLLVRSVSSLVSAGTERMLMEFGKAGYLQKARQQPEKVKQVIAKVKTDGFLTTYRAVKSKLDQPIPLGYCNAGIVVESGVESFLPGDRVITNGYHAELVRVPKNLCAKVPDSVDLRAATFSVPSSIGLQGIRLLQPTLGERFVVVGLGLIGLLAVQMLLANGCKVVGVDMDSERCKLARLFGAETIDLSKGEDPVSVCSAWTNNHGVDGVLITAASKSDEIIHQSAQMCRQRGRVVLVGVVGLNLRRDDFYKKEITFQVSASYGPGRYDPLYEEKGHDYPIGFVRWTEQRNFEAVLSLMESGKLNPEPLISHEFGIDHATEAYKALSEPSALGILLGYDQEKDTSEKEKLPLRHLPETETKVDKLTGGNLPTVSFLGAGNYALSVLIPAFKKAGVNLNHIISSAGVSGTHAAKKFGFASTATDPRCVFDDESADVVVIATRHNSHAEFVVNSLEEGKHVFVEKPLCLKLSELDSIKNCLEEAKGKEGKGPCLMVGFNRRFSPLVVKAKSLLDGVQGPKSFIMTVNAGKIPEEHWTQDPLVGGGRILGEGCHFIDLLRFLAQSPIQSADIIAMDSKTGDTASISLVFENGSIGVIHYFANGSKSYPKERLEVFSGERILQLDNFRRLEGYGWPNFRKMKLWRQDKGQDACAKAFIESIKSNSSAPIPIEELLEVGRISIELNGRT